MFMNGIGNAHSHHPIATSSSNQLLNHNNGMTSLANSNGSNLMMRSGNQMGLAEQSMANMNKNYEAMVDTHNVHRNGIGLGASVVQVGLKFEI